MQLGDLIDMWVDVSDLATEFGYRPSTTVEEGVKKFSVWFKEYYK